MNPFEEAIGRVLGALGPGEVVTYGEVAVEAGFPGAHRAVGRFLGTHEGYPWWRVVTSTGRLVPGLEADQARRLAEEGVVVRDGRVMEG
ncbi:MAG: MGMT family protein [Acidimicrobiales bacterium]|nr:MGMT family protein [Actinomycetes bacterium]MDP6106371.1 MGMT family protein [Acidimicrobiales bacterium]MDP7352480.1 MGMT family protein [Acidimicrobiales bacterium]HJO19736.1 MGMT family protein [Acidimicrobiales bacterium]